MKKIAVFLVSALFAGLALAGSAVLNWSAPTVTGYAVYWGTTVGGSHPTKVSVSGASTASTVLTGLPASSTICFVVRTAAGAIESSSGPEACGTSDAAGTMTASWGLPVAITGYTVKYDTVSGGRSQTAAVAGTSLTTTVAGLTNGVRYYFVVRGLYPTGQETVDSNEVNALIPLASATALPAPAVGLSVSVLP